MGNGGTVDYAFKEELDKLQTAIKKDDVSQVKKIMAAMKCCPKKDANYRRRCVVNFPDSSPMTWSADLDEWPDNPNGTSPLSEACKRGNIQIVRELLKHKCINPNLGKVWRTGFGTMRNGEKQTTSPLYICCKKGQTDIILELLKHPSIAPEVGYHCGLSTGFSKYNPTASSQTGRCEEFISPLYLALKNNHLRTAHSLISHPKIRFSQNHDHAVRALNSALNDTFTVSGSLKLLFEGQHWDLFWKMLCHPNFLGPAPHISIRLCDLVERAWIVILFSVASGQARMGAKLWNFVKPVTPTELESQNYHKSRKEKVLSSVLKPVMENDDPLAVLFDSREHEDLKSWNFENLSVPQKEYIEMLKEMGKGWPAISGALVLRYGKFFSTEVRRDVGGILWAGKNDQCKISYDVMRKVVLPFIDFRELVLQE